MTPEEKIAKIESRTEKTEDGCHIWTGAPSDSGYGWVTLDGKHVLVHREMYLLTHGAIHRGNEVRHKCHNKLCVNPDHLDQGTPKQNVDDARQAGHLNTTYVPPLDPASVRDIRRRHAAGEYAITLASEYGRSLRAIYRICARETYKDVE